MRNVTIHTGLPTVAMIVRPALYLPGINEMMGWVKTHRPECLDGDPTDLAALFPHKLAPEDGRTVTDAEIAVEIAGRKCYDSWGLKAGKKTNRDYIASTQSGEVPHRSIAYHPKFTFFIAGVSRRVSHELIRNYVGADRDEEGSPSQESTRYTEHYGWYIAHPAIVNDPAELREFERAMNLNYNYYIDYIMRKSAAYETKHGRAPTGLERKRIYESASPYLSHACETSWIWTTNPIALAKLFLERGGEGADLEFQRLAAVWAKVCFDYAPNLFPQEHVRVLADKAASWAPTG